ncbi:hypothetical protein SEA_KEANU_45 [Streptomyces phage Keanu]|nr:hypothetical protein SEA_KEANU_45 [Streptomyces phage Keanu]
MPKLDDKKAAAVDQAEDGFKPVPEGVYIVQLMEDVDVKEGDKGTYWRWTFEVPKEHEGEELEHGGRRFWTNTSLSDAAYFKLKETFGAFGVPTNTDTAELVGRKVKAMVTQRVIQGGQRKGEIGNEISKLLPLSHDEAAEAAQAVDTAKGGDNSDPLF